MRFANPWWLLLWIAVAGLGLVWWLKSRQPDGFRYPDLSAIRSALTRAMINPEWILGGLTLAALIVGIVALARPQAGLTTESISGHGVDIILCLDTSGSMRSVDFKPQNRLGAAKEVARKFITDRLHDRMGLVVFGGAAITVCPLTIDKQALLTLLDQVTIDMTHVDGTAVGMALALSAERLRTSNAKSKVIVLITDGRNNVGAVDPLTAAKAASALGIKVYAIGAGSPEGGLMPVQDPLFGMRYVRIPNEDLDEETLRKVAGASRGQYFRAKDSRGLAVILEQINHLEKSDYKVTEFTHYRDLYFGWLLAAWIFLLARLVLGETLLRRLP
jgi:Ca-activated chloride channel homolog